MFKQCYEQWKEEWIEVFGYEYVYYDYDYDYGYDYIYGKKMLEVILDYMLNIQWESLDSILVLKEEVEVLFKF